MTFREEIAVQLQQIDPELCWGATDPLWAKAYRYVERYAERRQYRNTALALPMVQKMIFSTGGLADSFFEDCTAQLKHCLEISRMLIDLHPELDQKDKDVLLAAALCHILPEGSRLDALDPEVGDILARTRRVDFLDGEKRAIFMNRVEENRLALLLRVADQGNFVEQLHRFSGWRTRRYIYETRTIYLPLCSYAKEHYPELTAPVSILMGKMQSLIEVAEIMQSRIEVKENELIDEIFSLREENARLQKLLEKFEKE